MKGNINITHIFLLLIFSGYDRSVRSFYNPYGDRQDGYGYGVRRGYGGYGGPSYGGYGDRSYGGYGDRSYGNDYGYGNNRGYSYERGYVRSYGDNDRY